MKYYCFELTMPNVGSWNGKWSGEGKKYYITESFRDKSDEAKKLDELLSGKTHTSFYYRWEDGWGANVTLERTNAAANAKRRKISVGFCGYNWMVKSILKRGKITPET